VADVNRDGMQDLATADDDGVSLLRGRRDGTLRDALLFPLVQPNFRELAGLDGDRSRTWSPWAVRRPTGDGPILIVAARPDEDRATDLATANQNGNDVSVLRNKP
jgi:hypothetical protein